MNDDQVANPLASTTPEEPYDETPCGVVVNDDYLDTLCERALGAEKVTLPGRQHRALLRRVMYERQLRKQAEAERDRYREALEEIIERYPDDQGSGMLIVAECSRIARRALEDDDAD